MEIALVTCSRLPDLDPDDAPLVAALGAAGTRARPVVWDDDAVRWEAFDLALIRSTWDYHHRRDEFLAWVDRAGAATRLVNPPAAIRWNSHKGYLLELAARGFPVTPTVLLARGQGADLAAILAARGWGEAVIKPAVSADSFATVRTTAGDPAEGQAHLDEHLRSRDMLVQRYLPAVVEPGERCLVWLGGRYSHTIRKRSKFLGGRWVGPEGVALEPEADELALAERLAREPELRDTAYARIDVCRDPEGRSCLMELELIEPTLFFLVREGAAERLVEALLARPGISTRS